MFLFQATYCLKWPFPPYYILHLNINSIWINFTKIKFVLKFTSLKQHHRRRPNNTVSLARDIALTLLVPLTNNLPFSHTRITEVFSFHVFCVIKHSWNYMEGRKKKTTTNQWITAHEFQGPEAVLWRWWPDRSPQKTLLLAYLLIVTESMQGHKCFLPSCQG